jgi:hypothetical protein
VGNINYLKLIHHTTKPHAKVFVKPIYFHLNL